MKHKHYELIVAWAEGKQIQVRAHNLVWEDRENPLWAADREYRIKPEPIPDIVRHFYLDSHPFIGLRFYEWYNGLADKKSVIKCTFDGETKKLKSAEVLK